MARVPITEFGVIQKLLAGATVQVFSANDSGENTGTLATLYQAATGSGVVSNPQTLDEDGKLSVDCYVDGIVVAEISNISDLADRSLKKLRANPTQFPLGATNAAFQGANVIGLVDDAEAAATQAGAYLDLMEGTFQGIPSTTNLSISSGSKTFTVAAGLPLGVGQYVIATSNANPTTHSMNGQITAYSSTSLTITTDAILGSGSRDDWTIRPSGPRGATGATGPAGAGSGDMLKSENLSGLASYISARSNLGLDDSATTSIATIRTIPQNSKSADYTLVLGDGGNHIFHPAADTTGRTITIPANASVAFPIGTAITLVNQGGAGDLQIAITSDTLTLAGSGTTGIRTLADNGIATILKITNTEWIISGIGLS